MVLLLLRLCLWLFRVFCGRQEKPFSFIPRNVCLVDLFYDAKGIKTTTARQVTNALLHIKAHDHRRYIMRAVRTHMIYIHIRTRSHKLQLNGSETTIKMRERSDKK